MFTFPDAYSWLLLLPLAIYFIVDIEMHEEPVRATIVALIAMLGFQFFTNIHPFTFIAHNPVESLLILSAYFVVGVIYIYVKWMSMVYKAARHFSSFLKEHNITATEFKDKKEIDNYSYSGYLGIRDSDGRSYGIYPPKINDFKQRVYGWLLLWPVDGLWTLLNDPIVRFCNWIWDSIKGSLQRISDKAFENYK